MTQHELFQDLKPKTERVERRVTPPVFVRKRVTLSFTAQQLGLIGMASVLVLVVSFAGGVERGKSLRLPGVAATQPPERVLHGTDSVRSQPPVAIVAPEIVVETTPLAAEARPVAPAAQPFTIQLATYTDGDAAERELDRLSLAGHEAFVLQGTNRVALCIGEFAEYADAKKQLPDFRKLYHDCFIRRR
jgi:hypothetical protein